ncbi:MAG: outer membrane protein assembly factor BamA [Spirochaetes bacterium]|nr:MAG: outer membrane protein assembly factor BamA [Spirochaetota bacterium]
MKRFLVTACAVSAALAIVLAYYAGGSSEPSRFEGKNVGKIEFQGLKNISEDDLRYNAGIETREGEPLKAAVIREDIKRVFNQGSFEDVRVEVEEYEGGVRVRFLCKERPIVKKITFKGVEKLYDTELSELVSIKEGEPLRIERIEKSVKQLKKKYDGEGLFNAVIKYFIKRDIDKDDPDAIELVFTIDEGEEIKVQKITILGAEAIPAKTLKGVMETEEDGFFKTAEFKKDIYEQDKAKIVALYKENGYLDAQILEDRVEYEWKDPDAESQRTIFVTIKVMEGERYYFDKYTMAGNKVFEGRVFEQQYEQTDSGEIFNDTRFQRDRQMISFTYASKGYIFTRVIPKRTVEEREVEVSEGKEKRKFVRIDFEIEEGSQAYVENIIVKGMKKTKEKVIRREILINEGELFNAYKVQISREKIFNLGFFKQVNIDMRPGSKEGYMNLIIDVEEQPTGTISLGGGYGTTSGFSIFADIGENNLLGNGQRVGVRFEYGPLRSSITLSFNEPWLFDMPVGFNASIFYMLNTIPTTSIFPNSDEQAEYQKQSIGYSLGLSRRFLYFYGVGTVWSHSFKSVLNPSGNSADAVFIEEGLGIQQKRTLTLYAYRDSKDNYMNPTGGSRIEIAAAFTGGYFLRGDDHYIKYSPDLYWYFSPFHLPLLKTHPCVIELRANASLLTPPLQRQQVEKMQPRSKDEWLESEDRLYVGGPETLRGWQYFDLTFPSSWRLGLFHRILYGAEFRIPIHPQMLWFAFFFDAASLWTDKFWEQNLGDTSLEIISEDRKNKELYDIRDLFKVSLMPYFRYSWGFGFKIQIPMMPLRFWFGRKMLWVGKDKGYFREISDFDFQFGIGDMRF